MPNGADIGVKATTGQVRNRAGSATQTRAFPLQKTHPSGLPPFAVLRPPNNSMSQLQPTPSIALIAASSITEVGLVSRLIGPPFPHLVCLG